MRDSDYDHTSIDHILDEVREVLPTQGPIDVFIHHNTLHAFEDLPFEDAVEQAAEVYGAEAFLPEQRYLDYFLSGRINQEDLKAVIAQEVPDTATATGISFRDLVQRYVEVTPPVEGFQEVEWLLRESQEAIKPQGITATSLIRWLTTHGACSNRRDALHTLNYEAAESLEAILTAIPRTTEIVSHERTVLWSAALLAVAEGWTCTEPPPSEDHERVLEEMIHPIVIRFCEEYLDLGFSNQVMPDRHEGMLACFLRMVDVAHFGTPGWLEPLRCAVSRYRVAADSVEALVERLLEECGVAREDRYNCLLREALALRGWAGYVALAERRPALLHGQSEEIRPRFCEYIAIRLLLRLYVMESSVYRSKCNDLPDENVDLRLLDDVYTNAYHILCLFTSIGRSDLLLESADTIVPLVRSLVAFDTKRRRRLWHLAYEHNLYVRALDLLAGRKSSAKLADSPAAQFVFCIEDREESIRRHLEARDSGYETFGTAGFFGVDANLTVMSGNSAPYCPLIVARF